MSPTPAYDALVAHHRQLHHLEHTQAILTWDRLTQMPKAAAPARAQAQAAFARVMKQAQDEPRVAQWLAQASVAQMTEVIRDYGEERFAGAVAKAIDRWRQQHGPLERTAELAQVVAGAVRTREPGKDPATRTFQAFRIFINAELQELQQALEASLQVLKPQGRLVVISFHSLEDRIVKQFMAAHARQVYDRRAPMAEPQAMRLRLIERIKPSQTEIAANARARSAVMRVAERTETL